MTILLGGVASPIGWSVQYVDAGLADVNAALVLWRRGLEQQLTISEAQPFPTVLRTFLPLEWPCSRELVLPCGGWTAYLDNSDGGDLSTSAGVVIQRKTDRPPRILPLSDARAALGLPELLHL